MPNLSASSLTCASCALIRSRSASSVNPAMRNDCARLSVSVFLYCDFCGAGPSLRTFTLRSPSVAVVFTVPSACFKSLNLLSAARLSLGVFGSTKFLPLGNSHTRCLCLRFSTAPHSRSRREILVAAFMSNNLAAPRFPACTEQRKSLKRNSHTSKRPRRRVARSMSKGRIANFSLTRQS